MLKCLGAQLGPVRHSCHCVYSCAAAVQNHQNDNLSTHEKENVHHSNPNKDILEYDIFWKNLLCHYVSFK